MALGKKVSYTMASKKGRVALASPLGRALLTKDSGGIPGSPLFQSQAEIAKAITELKNSGYRDQLNLRSFLNQVLAGKRRCNEKLAESLIEAIRNRFNSKHHSKVVVAIQDAIGAHNEFVESKYYARFPEDVPTGETIEEMKTKQKTSRAVIVITTRPLELIEDRSREYIWRNFIDTTIHDIQEGKKPYIFAVHERSTALLLLRGIHSALVPLAENDGDKASQIIKEREQAGLLTVYVIPPAYCVDSRVVYDAGSVDANGYVWYVAYDPNRAIKMPQQALENWTQWHFIPIKAEQLPGQTRIKWKETTK